VELLSTFSVKGPEREITIQYSMKRENTHSFFCSEPPQKQFRLREFSYSPHHIQQAATGVLYVNDDKWLSSYCCCLPPFFSLSSSRDDTSRHEPGVFAFD
jgi:hypothetical protein